MGVAYSVGEVDHLFTFFVQWSPDMCTNSNNKKKSKPHFQNWCHVGKKNKGASSKQLSNPVATNWGIITGKEPKRRLSLCSSDSETEEPEYRGKVKAILPVLSDYSNLLDDRHLISLASHMPERTQGYRWQLVYSTAVHGSSLKTLYRNMAGLDSPVLLVVKDMQKKVFGAFSSDPFRVSKYCYGTGETFLFTFNPDFQAYKWTGENSYFVSGNLESLHLGGGGGEFGLWIDADLYRGSSFSCPTFHNAPLSTQKDFIIQDLEVWTVRN
ncbi:nuclear receptor coactivator 7 isoform X1 [Phyllopteryx taeniolatus]|uniref:nuclear receptor coactivator 7 isoform X1 n=1 Tax=Phyllopteryx taeniolatus TaxID=161469 RepID=UPI002AD38439|nr:nuclear receptor coactivator 7 isoform X1 [Phyllopteryx taeniolatus]